MRERSSALAMSLTAEEAKSVLGEYLGDECKGAYEKVKQICGDGKQDDGTEAPPAKTGSDIDDILGKF